MSLRFKYLELCHEGHQGITKCCGKDNGDFIAKCDICIMPSDVKHKPSQESELPSKPWEVIASDVFVLGRALFVVIFNNYSKWIEANPFETRTSRAIFEAMKSVFSRFGFPNMIRSKNGRCYDSNKFRDFADEYGIVLATNSPRYPAFNGLAESALKTAKRLGKKV